MSRTVTITSAVALTKAEVDTLTDVLNLTASDSVTFQVDAGVIAGLRVNIDGQTVDLTVKRQLEKISE